MANLKSSTLYDALYDHGPDRKEYHRVQQNVVCGDGIWLGISIPISSMTGHSVILSRKGIKNATPGGRIRLNFPILRSTIQAVCWGTNLITVLVGNLSLLENESEGGALPEQQSCPGMRPEDNHSLEYTRFRIISGN